MALGLYAAGSLREALTEVATVFIRLHKVPVTTEFQVIAPPPALAVGADYGLTVLAGASDAAPALALFILSPDGLEILARHGFIAPARGARGLKE